MQAMSANTLHMHGGTNKIAHSPLLQVGKKSIFIDRTHVALARQGDIALSIHSFVCQLVRALLFESFHLAGLPST